MIFTPGERRLIASLIVFLGSAYLISGLRACHLLPDPAPDRATRAGSGEDPRVAPRDDPSEDAREDPPRADAQSAFAGSYLDLNGADSLALIALPGIGPTLAGRILAARAQRGRFDRLEELLEVRGIGEKRLEQLRLYLIVRSAPQP
jgi:competence ComEA-like helix-hairpin-helix protein